MAKISGLFNSKNIRTTAILLFQLFLSPEIGMLKYKVGCEEIEAIRISNSPITDLSLNRHTGVLAAACSDSSIFLTNLLSRSKSPPVSTVQMNLDSISSVEWLSQYEFVVGGSDYFIHYFSIMNLRSELFQFHAGNIVAMKKWGQFLYTGSSDGNACLWDIREESVIKTISHTVKSKKQPIKDIDTHGNYLFSTTLYQGKIWVWDLRNTKKSLNCVNTGKCQNCIEYIGGNLYTASEAGVLKSSPTLDISEMFYQNNEEETFTRNRILFNERYNSIIWTERDKLLFSGVEGESSPAKKDIGGVYAIENSNNDEILVSKDNGEVSLLKFSFIDLSF